MGAQPATAAVGGYGAVRETVIDCARVCLGDPVRRNGDTFGGWLIPAFTPPHPGGEPRFRAVDRGLHAALTSR